MKEVSSDKKNSGKLSIGRGNMILSKNSLLIALLLNMNMAFASDEVSNDGKISGVIRTFYINKKYTNPYPIPLHFQLPLN
jgi:hypothetical protein